MPKFRTPYDEDYNPLDHSITCDPAFQAQQQFKDECDINLVYPRYIRDGVLPPFMKDNPGVFDELGEAIDLADYRANLDRMIDAEAAFMELPAKTRKFYDNDPLKLLEAVQKGEESIYDLGLAKKPEPVDDKKPEPVDDPVKPPTGEPAKPGA